jgi:recombination protein RecA
LIDEDKIKIVKEINKKFGDGTIFVLGQEPQRIAADLVSTGSLSMDMALGGGFMRGRAVEIKGAESSGKTLLSLMTIASAQRQGLDCAFIDCEQTFQPEWAQKIGVNTDDLFISQPDGIAEDVFDLIIHLLDTQKFGVIVLDSLPSLIPKSDIDRDLEDGNKIGSLAMVTTNGLRKIINQGYLSKSQAVLILINQLRDKVGVVYGSPTTSPGGHFFRHAVSYSIEMRINGHIKQTVNGEQVRVGHTIMGLVSKNKVAPPYKTGQFDLYYDTGIDYVGELITMATKAGIINQAGPYYSYGDIKWRGKDAVKDALQDKELYNTIKNEVINCLTK